MELKQRGFNLRWMTWREQCLLVPTVAALSRSRLAVCQKTKGARPKRRARRTRSELIMVRWFGCSVWPAAGVGVSVARRRVQRRRRQALRSSVAQRGESVRASVEPRPGARAAV